jgi:hypothetical protein
MYKKYEQNYIREKINIKRYKYRVFQGEDKYKKGMNIKYFKEKRKQV